MTGMKSRLDKYLEVMETEWNTYFQGPLFVRTEPWRETPLSNSGYDITYETQVLGKGKDRRILRFTFNMDGEVVDENRFVKPKDAVIYNSKIFFVELGRPRGAPQVELEITAPELEHQDEEYVDLTFDRGLIKGAKSEDIDKLEDDLKKFEPETILKAMIGMYALGVAEYAKSGEIPQKHPK